ncbi:DEAD/DEAH box helicase family protein [Chryseobacterium sp. BIGb0232]|uniref:DEAD/DEAH box helicase family protein n=1 Tax=Chryseobacterium sp. BIGb0232 TaxID=2940598 RepID=UPI000F49D208|nr:DEAD/DEAH box helicase family protein [Chryseobacterium sp. BIGb0232]MCS4305327.1 superfamily II DNA or RNA helicase/virulence-associated protein VapD [Chryseobacterium sp. BIGb0232]ROS07538.1 type III restriction/modification enzyme restriction subunit [Chryseobacterium nakagawai]
MNVFPKNTTFKYNWRTYQKKFLDHLDEYLIDNHLHVSAPPGSGKTVLGLEVMLRLGKPTLIVAPTLAIKNQWIQRFCELFLNTETVPEWISSDIRKPGIITVTTYQGIHAASETAEEEEETMRKSPKVPASEIIKRLQKQKVGTLILDEAHHLKNAWWRSLTELKNKIEPTVVSLTATPPFDVSGTEWQKYIQLNGPIDAEISVPELMIEGDLCPHQDLVHFTLPSLEEQKKIEYYHKQALGFFEEIKKDDILLNAIEEHPVYQEPLSHLDWIYENISSYTSGLVYLHFRKKEIPEVHFEIIGDQQKYIPEFDFFWMEELLDFYLLVDEVHFKNYEDHHTDLGNRLKRHGFLEQNTLSFFNNKNTNQILNSSIGKLQGIQDIVDFESSVLKDDLRMVILTDFIKKEYLNNGTQNTLTLDKIGTVPIFEKLRRENFRQKKIGILTGSLVIIPVNAKSVFEELCMKRAVLGIRLSPLSYDPDYLMINLTEQVKRDIVHIITEIFQCGGIHVLIGTKSLLGEGWDAPKMNTLILASFISSFVLSNQMRGRVIRTDKDIPHKTGNIWHLVCFDPNDETGGQDLNIMKRRFKTFVGISNKDIPTIENNFERLNVKTIETKSKISEINQSFFVLAQDRKNLISRWGKALDLGNILVEEIQVPSINMTAMKDVKMDYVGKMSGNIVKVMASSVLLFWQNLLFGILRNIQAIDSVKTFSLIVSLFGLAGFIVYGRKLYISVKQYWRYRDIGKQLGALAEVVLHGLIHERVIRTSFEQLNIISSSNSSEGAFCYLKGGSQYESTQFIQTLQEMVSPVDNPRYILKQKKIFFFLKKEQYFPVPEIFAKNKKSAEFFTKTWNKTVGASELIFTRTIDGRNILLKLRFEALLKRNGRIEHLHKWTR